MSHALIACRMLEDEIAAAQEKCGSTMPIIWLERKLHALPKKLNAALQEAIDGAQQYDTLYLAFCRCGNALLGLRSPRAKLLFPRFDDCLHMMRSFAPGDAGLLDNRTLYFTQGWLHGETSTLDEYEACVARLGEKKTRRVYDVMMSQYANVALIDTGAFSVQEAMPRAQKTADLLHLAYLEVAGSNRVLEKMLCGKLEEDFEEDFVVIEPGEAISEECFQCACVQETRSSN